MWVILMVDDGYTPSKKTVVDVVDTFLNLTRYLKMLYEREPRLRFKQTPFESLPEKEEFVVGFDDYHKYVTVRMELITKL
jgi:hypothetical protein